MTRRPALYALLALAATATVAAAATLLVSSSAQAATTPFTPAADTYVQNDTPSTNYGTAGQINVDNSPVRRMFLRFSVTGVAGTISSVKLRLHVDNISNGGSSSGGAYRLMSNTTWSETAVTWNNQPAIDGAALGSLGS